MKPCDIPSETKESTESSKDPKAGQVFLFEGNECLDALRILYKIADKDSGKIFFVMMDVDGVERNQYSNYLKDMLIGGPYGMYSYYAPNIKTALEKLKANGKL